MKSLTNYIQSINEHFVNCKNEDEMHKYGDIVWSILKKAYEYCGGIKNVNNVEDLIKRINTRINLIHSNDKVLKELTEKYDIDNINLEEEIKNANLI